MMYSIRPIISLLAAGCGAACMYVFVSWLLNRPPSISRSLEAFGSSAAGSQEADAPPGTPLHKIRLAFTGVGLDVSGREELAYFLAIGLLGLGLSLAAAALDLPSLFWLGGPVIAYFLVRGFVNRAWGKVQKAIEKEIPSYLMNLSSMIQLTPNVQRALEDASLSLDPGGSLRPWILRFVSRLQSGGKKGLQEMQAEAEVISPSLLLLVVEVGRLWETGGQGYAQSFQMVAENLAGILEGRARASAKADGAWGTIRVIVLALGGSLFLAFSSPGSRALFRTPTAQVAVAVAVAWAIFGFSYIGDLIRQSVE